MHAFFVVGEFAFDTCSRLLSMCIRNLREKKYWQLKRNSFFSKWLVVFHGSNFPFCLRKWTEPKNIFSGIVMQIDACAHKIQHTARERKTKVQSFWWRLIYRFLLLRTRPANEMIYSHIAIILLTVWSLSWHFHRMPINYLLQKTDNDSYTKYTTQKERSTEICRTFTNVPALRYILC